MNTLITTHLRIFTILHFFCSFEGSDNNSNNELSMFKARDFAKGTTKKRYMDSICRHGNSSQFDSNDYYKPSSINSITILKKICMTNHVEWLTNANNIHKLRFVHLHFNHWRLYFFIFLFSLNANGSTGKNPTIWMKWISESIFSPTVLFHSLEMCRVCVSQCIFV